MNQLLPGIDLTQSARRSSRVLTIVIVSFMFIGSIYLEYQGLPPVLSGGRAPTARVKGLDVPLWILGLLALGLAIAILVQHLRERAVLSDGESIIGIGPAQGGMYLVCNFGQSKGASLPVADGTAVLVELVPTRLRRNLFIKLYDIRVSSAHGQQTFVFGIAQRALDASALKAEAQRRRVALTLDPRIPTPHDLSHAMTPTAYVPGVASAQPTHMNASRQVHVQHSAHGAVPTHAPAPTPAPQSAGWFYPQDGN